MDQFDILFSFLESLSLCLSLYIYIYVDTDTHNELKKYTQLNHHSRIHGPWCLVGNFSIPLALDDRKRCANRQTYEEI